MSFWVKVRQKMAPLLELQPDSDFFAVLDWQLLLSGVKLKSNRLWLRMLFRAYQFLLPVQCAIWLYRTIVVAFVEHNTTLALSLYCGQFALTTLLIRHVISIIIYDSLEPVRGYINSQRFLQSHPKARELRQRAFRKNNIFVLMLIVYSFVNFLIYEMFNMQRHDIFRLPDYTTRIIPRLSILMQSITHFMTMIGIGAFVSSFLIMHTMLSALKTEFLLVEFSFSGLLARNVKQVQPHLLHSETENLLWSSLNREISICVREHCEVVKYIREVNRVFSFSIIVQYYTTLLALAIDTFFILYNGLDFVTFMVIVFSLLLVIEWYYYCKLVEDLQAINARIGWTLYNDNWPAWLQYGRHHPESLRQFRNTLSIMLLASQRSISFHGSSIIEVSWQTFGNLFKMSYSVLMFLVELRKLNR